MAMYHRIDGILLASFSSSYYPSRRSFVYSSYAFEAALQDLLRFSGRDGHLMM